MELDIPLLPDQPCTRTDEGGVCGSAENWLCLRPAGALGGKLRFQKAQRAERPGLHFILPISL